MAELTINAYAKINLTLEVVRRLPTGYHELRTIFQQVDLCDELLLADCPADAIELACDDHTLPIDPTNLVWRAADLIRRTFGPQRGVRIHLSKRIPVGGGLAGGSTDAAATLIGLSRLWRLDLPLADLLRLGAQLGMDVPFCVLGGTALGTGRGEVLQPLMSLAGFPTVIAHPGASVSTAEAYAGLRPEQMGGGDRTETMVAAISTGDRLAIAAGLFNVFERSAIERVPAIARVKALMLEGGALNAALSGSGACVFGLARTARQAAKVAAAVRREFPHVFVTQTRASSASAQGMES